MASRTYHISFPAEWAKELDEILKKEHYSASEYFKMLYRKYKEEQWLKDLAESEEDFRAGRVVHADSLADLID